MLTVLAHAGRPIEPHDLWTAWRPDPLLALAIGLTVALYMRGTLRRNGRHDGRSLRFLIGTAVLVGAAMSPLEAASGALASAHMIQHLVLVLVAAPLIASSRPVERAMLGLGVEARRAVGRTRRALRLTPATIARLRSPVLVGAVTITTMWAWHSSSLYEAALGNDLVHHLEHGTLVAVYAAFWWMVFEARSSAGFSLDGVLVVFAVMMSNVALGALMTFARSAWYGPYADSTQAWGLSHLADQQLAGVLMWVPPTLVLLPAALWIALDHLREPEDVIARPSTERDRPSPRASGTRAIE